MSPTEPSEFYVSVSQREVERLRRFRDRATSAGNESEFLNALNEIQRKLRTILRTWGDPLRRFKGLSGVSYRGMHSLLYVFYTVLDERNVVLVERFLGMPRTPLEGTQ